MQNGCLRHWEQLNTAQSAQERMMTPQRGETARRKAEDVQLQELESVRARLDEAGMCMGWRLREGPHFERESTRLTSKPPRSQRRSSISSLGNTTLQEVARRTRILPVFRRHSGPSGNARSV